MRKFKTEVHHAPVLQLHFMYFIKLMLPFFLFLFTVHHFANQMKTKTHKTFDGGEIATDSLILHINY